MLCVVARMDIMNGYHVCFPLADNILLHYLSSISTQVIKTTGGVSKHFEKCAGVVELDGVETLGVPPPAAVGVGRGLPSSAAAARAASGSLLDNLQPSAVGPPKTPPRQRIHLSCSEAGSSDAVIPFVPVEGDRSTTSDLRVLPLQALREGTPLPTAAGVDG
jgi:hypothetical protein